MSRSILIVSATNLEAETLKKIGGLRKVGDANGYFFGFNGLDIELLVTGIGTTATAYSLTRRLYCGKRPDMAINIGIAGSYRDEIHIGEVVVPGSDCFGDAGVETADGFQTLFQSGLSNPSEFPFIGGRIVLGDGLGAGAAINMKRVTAVTLNTGSSKPGTIASIRENFNPDIETMEGAAFYYICAVEKLPFMALRSVSNMVGPRDKSKWNIPLAIENLSISLKEVLIGI